MHRFSHHLPVFVSIPLKTEIKELPKYITVTKTSPQGWENLKNELNEVNWSDIFNTGNLFSNPSSNYNAFIDKLTDLKNKHMPTKKNTIQKIYSQK